VQGVLHPQPRRFYITPVLRGYTSICDKKYSILIFCKGVKSNLGPMKYILRGNDGAPDYSWDSSKPA
jgi:hypothetical protein